MSSLELLPSKIQDNFKWLIQKLIVKMNKERDNEDAAYHINRGALTCFTTLCNTLSINNRVIEVNLSGCNINVYYAIEISELIQKNNNIQVLNLGGCKINSFGLSCIFKAMIDHTGIKVLNLYNNQAFTTAVVQDFCRYVLCGKNQLQEINLSHCNIENSLLAQILDKIHNLNTLRRIKLSLMSLNYEGIIALSSMMLNYTGKLSLDYLDISYNQIKNDGIALLAKGLFMQVRYIRIKSLNLSGNNIQQTEFLEQIIQKIQLDELYLQRNGISEFQSQTVLNMKLLRIDLSHNRIEEIPNNFFLNVIYLNLSHNQIDTEGAYQISQILCSNKVKWMYLDLGYNRIKTKGFVSIVYALIENNRLINLSVSNNQINGEGILVYIFNHEQIRLQYLDLSLNQLRYDLVYALISMMKESNLKTLILSQLILDESEISSGQLDSFEIKCTNLREMDFSYNPQIIFPVLESLSKQYNRLEYLNLNSCKLNQTILIERLSNFIEKTYTLSTLYIANNNLGSLPIYTLELLNTALSKNTTLLSLDLSRNKLRNSILIFVNGLSNCCTLRELDLSNNLIDENDAIIRRIPLIFKNRNLQYVNLSKNWIHGKTLKSIKQFVQRMHYQFPQLILQNLKLTADDLLVISDIIADIYTFKTLDISMNQSIDYLNNFTVLADNKIINSLTINKMQYRYEESYQNLQKMMRFNEQTLKIIEISNTLISQNYLLTLINGMQHTKQLTSLILEYQVIENDYIIDGFNKLIQVRALLNLQHLIIKKSTLSIDFFQILKKLLIQTSKLIELDVSENKINKQKFEILCQGVAQNFSLQTLNIACIKLDDNKCRILIQALLQNQTIRYLDLSRNLITKQSYYAFFNIFQNNIFGIQTIKFSKTKKKSIIKEYPDYQYDFLINFSMPEPNLWLFINLINLDLSRVKYQQKTLKQLLDRIHPNQIFQNVINLKFDECQFEDSHCELFCELLKNQIKLQELSLATNNITSNGFKKLFSIILQDRNHLQRLIVSNNQIEGKLLENRSEVILSHFNLLLIDNNKVQGCQDLEYLLQKNNFLYIYNTWTQITENLAIQLVVSYINYSKKYHIKQTPFYLKNLIIKDSNLTDNFLIWFGTKYFQFQHLEMIDFTGSTKFSTSVGKMHLYISMINEQFKEYNLTNAKIDNEQRVMNIFDDGILYYYLMILKNYLLKRSNNVKWIVKFITKELYKYTDFKLSNSLYSYLRKKRTFIKIYCLIQQIIPPIQAIVSIIIGIQFQHIVDPRQVNQNCKKQNPCYFTSFNLMITALSIIFFQFSAMLQIFNLFVAIKIRVNAIPDYCIRTFDEKKKQIFSFPHKKEIFLFLIQYFIQTDYYFECEVIGFCANFIFYLQEQNLHQDIQYKFFVILFMLSSITICKFIITIYTNYINSYNLKTNLDADQATLFSYVWKMSENNYVLERILRQYCPQIGIQVKNHLLNTRQIQEFFYALLIDLPTMVCIGMYYNLSRQYFEREFDTFIIPSNYFLFMVGYVRVTIGFFFHLNVALTTRPSQVNGFDINQTLLQRRYQQFNKEKEKQQQVKNNIDINEEVRTLISIQKFKSERKIYVSNDKKER